MGVSPESPIPLPRVSAADLAPVGLVALGGDGRILYANARARELLGDPEGGGLVGADARSFHAVPEVALSTAHDHLEGDRLRDLELTLRRRDGGAVTVRIQGRLASDGPAGVAVVLTLEDVGDRRAAEERAL